GYGSINGTSGLMVAYNLGFGGDLYRAASPVGNYLHPLLFVGGFLPFIAARWRAQDDRLRAVFLTLVPLLFAGNPCFGWMDESRNSLPVGPVRATMAVPARAGAPPVGAWSPDQAPTAGR